MEKCALRAISVSIDWGRLEEVVERAVRRARSEDLKEMAEAIKTLAEFMKTGFGEMLGRIDRVEKRLEEHSAILQNYAKTLQELTKTLQEHSKRLEGLSRLVTVIAHRFGVLSEESFKEAIRYVVEEVFGVAKVEKWIYNDVEGFVHGAPSVIEVDIVVKDREHILQLKASPFKAGMKYKSL